MGGTRQLATLVGFSAIVMWALLALLTVRTGAVPPFQLTAMCFALSGGIGLVRWLFIPSARAALRQPPAVWITGVAGLFLYHAFYFTALRNAPAVDASLIAYLWPLFIVLFSSLLPGERLLGAHLAGAGMGLAGAALIVTGRGSVDLDPAHAVGYPVIAVRVAAVAFGGMMAGFAGAYASVVYTPLWADGMIAGRGWIAIALVVFGTWLTGRVFLGACLFGAVSLTSLAAQATGLDLPSQLLSSLPYLVTILVLGIISADRRLLKLNGVASLGEPFER